MNNEHKKVQYNHNWILYNSSGTIINQTTKTNCYSYLRSYFNKDNHVVIWSLKEDIPYDDGEIRQYIDLLNQIPLFKIKYDYNEELKRCEFTLQCKDYDSVVIYVAVMMCIRYLWENHITDKFYLIPMYFMELRKLYPNEDLLYLLTWAHYYMIPGHGRYSYNTNHCLIYPISEDSNKSIWDKDCIRIYYPIKCEDFKISPNFSVNNSFTGKSPFSYSKTKEEYIKQLKEIKQF